MRNDMKYGLYFTLSYAENDIEFIKMFDRLNKTDGNDRIIQYIRLDKFLNYVKELDNINRFNSTILYLNNGWQYGHIMHDTIVIDRNSADNELDVELFMTNIKSQYPPENKSIIGVELICELPLSSDIFKFFYVSQFGGYELEYYKNKYLKYKNKYLKYKYLQIKN